MADSKANAEAAERSSARSKSAAKPKTSGKDVKKSGGKEARTRRTNPISRLIRFVREVVAELRKVIWPTRKELITYTTVVIIFVAVVVSLVWLLDVGFARAVSWAFGGSTGT